MLLRRNILMALVVGTFVLSTAALSQSQFSGGNNNGNGNIGSGNGNCNSGSNNGNGNVGNGKGNGSIAADDIQRKQMKQLQELLKDLPLGVDISTLIPNCMS